MRVKNSRANISLVGEINASCLEGLEDYGFMWLIFINDNGLPKNQKVALGVNLDGKLSERNISKCYNPIGLSLAKILRVHENTVYLSGTDLADGTPIVDIKPYHYLDSRDVPSTLSPAAAPKPVIFCDFPDTCKLEHFDTYEEIKPLIEEIL